VIDGIKRQLHQQVQTAFDQIARLTEAKQQLIRVATSFLFVSTSFIGCSIVGFTRQTNGVRYL
jgi:hypothetical protein